MDISYSISPINKNDVAAFILEGLDVEPKLVGSDLQQFEQYCAACTEPQHIQNKLIQLFNDFEQRVFEQDQLIRVLQSIVAKEYLRSFITCHVFLLYKYLKLQELPYFTFPLDARIEKEVHRVSLKKRTILS